MLFSDTYISIEAPVTGLYKDRGSKFMAFAFPVNDPNEIKRQLEQLKREHPSAAHHCYAWRLGADKQRYRVYDDAEPSGTAGKPIFAEIQRRDLSNVLVVVVRYFGGNLLGVPGLIQAYRGAAADALMQASCVEKQILEAYRMEFDADDIGAVNQLLKSVEAHVIDRGYSERHCWTIRVRKALALRFEEKQKELYHTTLSPIQTL